MVEFALLIAEGRGDNPSILGGVAIVLGIVVGIALLGFAAHALLHRFGHPRPETQERRPQRPGRVGRISKQQGP